MSGEPSPRSRRNAAVDEAVSLRDRPALERLARAEPGRVLRRILLRLHAADAREAWRAAEAMGFVAAALPPGEPAVEEALRSLFWMMNDESGNLCRMAPEAIGFCLLGRPDLRPAFAPLLPQYADEEPFEAGALWALCRLVEAGAPPPRTVPGLGASLRHGDPRRRGLAARLATLLGFPVPADLVLAPYPDYDPATGEMILIG